MTRSGVVYDASSSANVILLQGQTPNEEAASITLSAAGNRRLGAKGSFDVPFSALQSGNTIVIAYLHQTTDVPGGKAHFFGEGGTATIKTGSGQPIGTLQIDTSGVSDGDPDCAGGITLHVTNTIVGSGTTTLSFERQWMGSIGYATSPEIMRKMPFSNTIEVRRTGDVTPLRSYSFHFNGMNPTRDATQLGTDTLGLYIESNQITSEDNRYHEIAHTDAQFAQLQATDGAQGVDSPSDIRATYRVGANNQEIRPAGFAVNTSSWYVSARTHQVQADHGTSYPFLSTYPAGFRRPIHDAGAGLAQSELRQLADADGSTCVYCSRQSDGSWLYAATVKAADMVLTDAQIEAMTRSNSAFAAPNASDADVQATLDFYHGVLANHATSLKYGLKFSLSDQYVQTTITQQSLDDNGNVTGTITGQTIPTVATSSSETSVAVHRLRLDGQTLGNVTRSAGKPTGMDDATGVQSTATYALPQGANAGVPGYTLLGGAGSCAAAGGGCMDVDSLDAGQQQTLLATVSRLGLKGADGVPIATVEGLKSLASHDPVGNRPSTGGPQVWYTGNASAVDYPGESGVWYDSSGHQAAAGSSGATEGWGNTDVYYLYVGNPETVRVHWVDMKGDQSQDLTANKNKGTENASSLQIFTGRSGDALHTGVLSGSVPEHSHISAVSPGVSCTGGSGGGTGGGASCSLDTTYDANNTTVGKDDPSPQDIWIYYADNAYSVTDTRTVSRTVTYRRAGDGSTEGMPAAHTDSLAFDQVSETFTNPWNPQPVTVGRVWKARDGTTLPAVAVPGVAGYLTNKRSIPAVTGLNQDDSGKNYDVTVTYNKSTGLLPFTGASGLALLAVSAVLAVVFLVLAVVLANRRRRV